MLSIARISILAQILLWVQLTQGQGKYDDLPAEIKAILRETKNVGISVALIHDYKVAWAGGFGLTDVDGEDSVTTQTVFQAASITKSVVALTVMREVQEGKLALDEDVNTYLRSWKIPDNDFTRDTHITLRQLLSHTAGISSDEFPFYLVDEKLPTTTQALNGLSPARNKPVTVSFFPGARYNDSAGGYCIIQEALTDSQAKGFQEIVDETVLMPLGMSHSTFNYFLPDEKCKSVAAGHLKGNVIIKGRYYILQPLSFGGLWSTPTDLATMLVEIQNSLRGTSNKIVNGENARILLTPISNSPTGQYALGFDVTQGKNGMTFFGHDGHNHGFVSSMLASMDGGFGVVIMTNSENGLKAINKIKKLVGQKHWGF